MTHVHRYGCICCHWLVPCLPHTSTQVYRGLVRLLQRLPTEAAADAMEEDDAAGAAQQERTMVVAWMHSVLRRYALPSAQLGSRLRGEVAVPPSGSGAEGAAAAELPEAFREAVLLHLHVSLD